MSKIKFKKLNIMNDWKKTKLNYIRSKNVPSENGIYLIIKVKEWIYDIPMGLEVIYVGIGNLKTRFKDHSSIIREHNHKLAGKIQKEKLEFWYKKYQKPDLKNLEDRLIVEFTKANPNLTNILGKPKINHLNNKGVYSNVR